MFCGSSTHVLCWKWSLRRGPRQVCSLAGVWKYWIHFAFSPDGKRIVSDTYDGRLQIWNAETGAEVSELVRVRLRRGAMWE